MGEGQGINEHLTIAKQERGEERGGESERAGVDRIRITNK